MILYNVTVILDEEIQQEYLEWLKQKHVPEVMKLSGFASSRILKVLDSPNEGVTYCIQYVADSREQYDNYLQHHAPALRNSFPETFTNKFVVYRSLMEYVN